ncbi:hypothetical protein PR048_003622, partial [Dryococelus australis]
MMRYFEMLTSESSSNEDEMACDNIRLVAANQSCAADNETDNSSSESGKDNTAVYTSCGDVVDWIWEKTLIEPMCHPFTVDNETLDPADPLRKIRPISMASDSFRAVYTPSGSVCIDESLMKCRGRLYFVQYNKSKRARFGIKFYKLCDSTNSTAILTEMMQKCDLLNKGYSLYIDNWYSSLDLFHRLFSAGTNVCGTVRTNRKHMPKELAKEKLKVGEAVAYSSTNITAMKWKDKREAYKKIFFYVVGMMLLNSYVLYKKLHGKKDRTSLVFKQKLAELLESYFKEDVVKRRSATPGDLPPRLSGRHLPEKLAPSAAKGAKFAKCCVVCLEKKQRRESTWKFDSCNFALCIEHFKPYHTLKNYYRQPREILLVLL